MGRNPSHTAVNDSPQMYPEFVGMEGTSSDHVKKIKWNFTVRVYIQFHPVEECGFDLMMRALEWGRGKSVAVRSPNAVVVIFDQNEVVRYIETIK